MVVEIPSVIEESDVVGAGDAGYRILNLLGNLRFELGRRRAELCDH